MKKKNKKIIIISSIAFLILAALAIYTIMFREDSDTSLTLVERQWVESNRSRVFDFGILNNVPVFSRDGQGVMFDFFNDLEEEVTLNFNKSSHRSSTNIQSDYSFKVVNNKSDDDILVYQDHFVLLSNLGSFNNVKEIEDIEIAVLDDYLSKANDSFKGASNISFSAYGTIDEMLEAYSGFEDEDDEGESTVDAIILPFIHSLELIVSNDDLDVSYKIYDMTQDYVITLGEEDRLNNIITKYFENWRSQNFINSFNINYSSDYFLFKDIGSQERADFRSKRYIIGVLENQFYFETQPFEIYRGFHYNLISSFRSLADVEVEFRVFENNEQIINAFNANEIDFYYDNLKEVDYNLDVVRSSKLFEDKFVLVSEISNDYTISNINSLNGHEVLSISDTSVYEYLNNSDISVTSFDTVSDLLSNLDSESVLALDYNTFNYLNKNELNLYDVLYVGSSSSNNNYVFRDISDNEVFNEFLSFYVDGTNINSYKSGVMSDLIAIETPNYVVVVFNYLGYLLLLSIIGYFINAKIREMSSSKKKTINKGDKLKYIDMLTSLKNRNYLSENVEAWDESEVYPQSIVIIDLNNLAYVNDNYGHQEGDKIIKEAANVLITTQVENSEIVRTDGNEFLVYMVGHEDKQVSSYVKKIQKELKNISHNFGAAVGYSMIENGIKTIDDAINEATLDMKKEKEELNN